MPKLKSCPFCGSDDVRLDGKHSISTFGNYRYYCIPVCSKCNATIIDSELKTESQAIKAWNRRI